MQASVRRNRLFRKILRQRYLYIMLFPALIGVAIFSYIPLSGWYMAFTSYRVGRSMWEAPWAGLYQFKSFFLESSDALSIIRNTVIMNVLTILVGLSTSFLFAILLKEVRFKAFGKFVQTVSFFPYFMSWVILYSLIYAMFAVESGAINQTLVELGILNEGLNILGDKAYSWWLIVVVNTWNYLGYNSVIFIASIAGIPEEQYEAAEIDGADRFQRVLYVTIPHMIPTLIVLLIMNSGWIFNSSLDQYFCFTNATNRETMEVFDMYIYRYGLKLLNYSYATAVGLLKTVFGFTMLIIVNNLSRRYSEKSIF